MSQCHECNNELVPGTAVKSGSHEFCNHLCDMSFRIPASLAMAILGTGICGAGSSAADGAGRGEIHSVSASQNLKWGRRAVFYLHGDTAEALLYGLADGRIESRATHDPTNVGIRYEAKKKTVHLRFSPTNREISMKLSKPVAFGGRAAFDSVFRSLIKPSTPDEETSETDATVPVP